MALNFGNSNYFTQVKMARMAENEAKKEREHREKLLAQKFGMDMAGVAVEQGVKYGGEALGQQLPNAVQDRAAAAQKMDIEKRVDDRSKFIETRADEDRKDKRRALIREHGKTIGYQPDEGERRSPAPEGVFARGVLAKKEGESTSGANAHYRDGFDAKRRVSDEGGMQSAGRPGKPILEDAPAIAARLSREKLDRTKEAHRVEQAVKLADSSARGKPERIRGGAMIQPGTVIAGPKAIGAATTTAELLAGGKSTDAPAGRRGRGGRGSKAASPEGKSWKDYLRERATPGAYAAARRAQEKGDESQMDALDAKWRMWAKTYKDSASGKEAAREARAKEVDDRLKLDREKLVSRNANLEKTLKSEEGIATRVEEAKIKAEMVKNKRRIEEIDKKRQADVDMEDQKQKGRRDLENQKQKGRMNVVDRQHQGAAALKGAEVIQETLPHFGVTPVPVRRTTVVPAVPPRAPTRRDEYNAARDTAARKYGDDFVEHDFLEAWEKANGQL